MHYMHLLDPLCIRDERLSINEVSTATPSRDLALPPPMFIVLVGTNRLYSHFRVKPQECHIM